MDFDQGEFNFEQKGDESGYREWMAELDRKKADFERRWGVRLGKQVSLQLRGFAKPVEGTIRLDPAHRPAPGKPHRLVIGSLEFFPGDIESLRLLRTASPLTRKRRSS